MLEKWSVIFLKVKVGGTSFDPRNFLLPCRVVLVVAENLLWGWALFSDFFISWLVELVFVLAIFPVFSPKLLTVEMDSKTVGIPFKTFCGFSFKQKKGRGP